MLLLQAEQPFIWRFTPTECLVIVGILTVVAMVLIFVAQQIIDNTKKRREGVYPGRITIRSLLERLKAIRQMKNEEERDLGLAQVMSELGQKQIAIQGAEITAKIGKARTTKERADLRDERSNLERAERFIQKAREELTKLNYIDAEKILEASLELIITQPALCMLGFVHLEFNRFGKALEMYNAAINLRYQQRHPPDPMLLLYMGVVYRRWGLLHDANNKYDEAGKLWRAANESPHYLLYWCRGVVYAKLCDFVKAIENLELTQKERSRQNLPEHPELLVDLGLIFAEQHNYIDASTYFESAIALSNESSESSNIDYYINLGRGLCLIGQYREALAVLNRGEVILDEHKLPKNANLTMNRGLVYAHQELFKEALSEYNTADRLVEKQQLHCCVELAALRGEIYRKQKCHIVAYEGYVKTEDLRRKEGLPVDPTITFHKAMLHYDQGDLITACELACQARDMYAEHKLQAPVHPNILAFIEKHCTCQDEQVADSGPGQGPAPTGNAE